MNQNSSDRFYQVLLVVSILGLSWLGMMVVHEFGHCLHAWVSGGTVSRVVLHPLVISRTDLSRNPHPLFVAWGGPVAGSILPILALAIARLERMSIWYLFQFFAGFCLVINGIYIAEDSFFRMGDSGDLIRYGAPQWLLIAFGVVTISLGLYFWNGLGPYFGLGDAKGKVNRAAALGTFCAFLSVIVVELLTGSR